MQYFREADGRIGGIRRLSNTHRWLLVYLSIDRKEWTGGAVDAMEADRVACLPGVTMTWNTGQQEWQEEPTGA